MLQSRSRDFHRLIKPGQSIRDDVLRPDPVSLERIRQCPSSSREMGSAVSTAPSGSSDG